MGGQVVLAYDYPVLGVFWSAMWVFLWVLWIFLLFRVVIDIFRDDSMNGLGKTGWLLFVIVLPFIGVLAYVVVRGSEMGSREQQHARAERKVFDNYVRDTAGGGEADQLAKLSELRTNGHLSEEEFQRAKERVLS